jgi:hypothetical protein
VDCGADLVVVTLTVGRTQRRQCSQTACQPSASSSFFFLLLLLLLLLSSYFFFFFFSFLSSSSFLFLILLFLLNFHFLFLLLLFLLHFLFLLLFVGPAGTPPIALVILTPLLFLHSSPEALHARQRRKEVWARNGRLNFDTIRLPRNYWVL